MLVIRLLFSFLWLTPLLMVGWTIGLIFWPVYHGFRMIGESIGLPKQSEHEDN